jgi:patatin-related protein
MGGEFGGGPVAVTRPGPRTQDLRVAVAMTGGASLAVWIGGVVRELNLLQQAGWLRDANGSDDPGSLAGPDDGVRMRYLRLISLLDVTVSIDIMSGTGGGGINAAVLGMARACPCDLGALRDMWLEAGAFDTLLREPAGTSPPSLLDGDVLLDRLRAGMKTLGGRPSPARPPLSACGAVSGRPLTRVFIASTLLAGEASWFTDDAGTLVQDMDHRGLFAFGEADLAGPGAWDALAVAARSSMAFPVAFEPAFVAHTEVPGSRHLPVQPAMGKFANITHAHWAADGGLLTSRPFTPLLQAIYDRTAERQVRRVLLYVVPSAGDPVPAGDISGGAPPTFGEALLQDLSAVLNQSISADLKALREHNDRVDSLRVTRLRMADFGVRLRQAARTRRESVAASLVTPQMMDDYCYRQARFAARPVIEALIRVLNTMPANQIPAPFRGASSPGRSVERDCREAAAAAIAQSWRRSESNTSRYARLACFGPAPYEGAEATVLSMIRAGFTLAADDGQRQELSELSHAVHRAHAAAEPPDIEDFVADRIGAPAAVPGTLAERAGGITLAYARELARPGPRREDYRLRQGEDDTLAGGWQRLAAAVASHHRLLRDLARSVAQAQSAGPLGPAMPEVPARPDGRGLSAFPAAPERDALGQRRLRAAAELDSLLRFLGGDADGIADGLFDLYVATRSVLPVGLEVEQRIELVQLSADTRNLLAPERDSAKSKLTGLQLYQLGAFYKSSWRANDWMWGRLDGAGWLVHLLLDPRRVQAISRQQQAGQRASWFYDRLRNLTGDDPPSQQAVLEELAYLDDDTGYQPTPASLPQTALWIACGWQRDIAVAELPVIAREILSTPSRRPSQWAQEVLTAAGHQAIAAAAARAAGQAAASGHWTREQRTVRRLSDQQSVTTPSQPDNRLLASRLRDCPVPDEKLTREIGEPLFTRTIFRAAAVAAAIASGTTDHPAVLRTTFTAARHITLAGYRAATLTSGRPRALIAGGTALLILGLVAVIQGSSLLGLTGILLLLTGAYLTALGTWSLSPRILRLTAAVIVAGVVLLPGTPAARSWLFGKGCELALCPGTGQAGHLLPWFRGPWHWPIFALLVVLLLLVLTRRPVRAASRRRTKPPRPRILSRTRWPTHGR